MELYAADPGDDEIGRLGGPPLGQGGIVSLFAPATHDVKAPGELFEQARNIGRVVLAIPVHGDDDIAPGLIDAGAQGGGLSEVLSELDHDHPGVPGRQGLEDGLGPVRASIVYQDDLTLDAEPVQHGCKILIQRSDVPLLIEQGDNYGEAG